MRTLFDSSCVHTELIPDHSTVRNYGMSASFGEWGSSFSSRIVRSPLTGDVAWLLFEYCITLDQEVDLFWGQKITGASVLYLSNRYLPLFCSLWWVPWWRQSLSFNVSCPMTDVQ